MSLCTLIITVTCEDIYTHTHTHTHTHTYIYIYIYIYFVKNCIAVHIKLRGERTRVVVVVFYVDELRPCL
jgi:hypothetical protein